MTPSATLTETGELRIVLPWPTPSNNEIRKMHPQAYARRKRELIMVLQLLTRNCRRIAVCRRRVSIERHGSRALDRDNLFGGCKILLDALRAAGGLLIDDSPKWLELDVINVKSKRVDAHTVVIVEDLP